MNTDTLTKTVKRLLDIIFVFVFLQIYKSLSRIESMICYSDLQFLFLAARDGCGEGAIVEIGSYMGASTAALALGSKLLGREKVFSIDPHCWGTEKVFLENLARVGVTDHVIPLIKSSEEAAETFDSKIRLLFIDGKHDYESVKKDISLWKDRVIEGGIISMHDYELPDVARAIDELIRNNGGFIIEGAVGCSLLISKIKQRNRELFDGIRIFNKTKRLLFPWKRSAR